MEISRLFRVPLPTIRTLMRNARASEAEIPGMTTFSGFPTAMIFAPSNSLAGSLHYMFFPTPAEQRAHRHPGDRYLLLLGDVDVHIAHCSFVSGEDDPRSRLETLVLKRGWLHAVRFPANHWHQFATVDPSGSGVLAFSFHGDDHIDLDQVSTGLMEELTFFLPGEP
jgi:hypothetical protein